jgi:molybdopterin/thiamine biosynthesis adenylyltransferase
MTPSSFNWTDTYRHHVARNLGILSEADQETLRLAKVAVLGLGGIGGPCFEVLVRSGIGRFSVVDKDVFDASNLNRQVYAFHSTLGRRKTDVSRDIALDINPELEIETFEEINEENVGGILSGADAVSVAIDELKPCVVAARKARELNIPVVETWALPFGNVRVLTRDTPSLEAAYGLPTEAREISDIADEEFKALGLKVILDLGAIDGIRSRYRADVGERIQKGAIPSFAPYVWFSSMFLAVETIKVVLGLGEIAHGPRFTLYDPLDHEKKHQ